MSMNKIVLVVFLLFLGASTLARAEPTNAEFEQAIQSAITRIKGDRAMLDIVVSLPAFEVQGFIADVALEELLKMEKLKNGEPIYGENQSF